MILITALFSLILEGVLVSSAPGRMIGLNNGALHTGGRVQHMNTLSGSPLSFVSNDEHDSRGNSVQEISVLGRGVKDTFREPIARPADKSISYNLDYIDFHGDPDKNTYCLYSEYTWHNKLVVITNKKCEERTYITDNRGTTHTTRPMGGNECKEILGKISREINSAGDMSWIRENRVSYGQRGTAPSYRPNRGGNDLAGALGILEHLDDYLGNYDGAVVHNSGYIEGNNIGSININSATGEAVVTTGDPRQPYIPLNSAASNRGRTNSAAATSGNRGGGSSVSVPRRDVDVISSGQDRIVNIPSSASPSPSDSTGSMRTAVRERQLDRAIRSTDKRPWWLRHWTSWGIWKFLGFTFTSATGYRY